jgi:hypothetical protein
MIIEVWHLSGPGYIGAHPDHFLISTRTFDLLEHLIVETTSKSYDSRPGAIVLGANVGRAIGWGLGRDD